MNFLRSRGPRTLGLCPLLIVGASLCAAPIAIAAEAEFGVTSVTVFETARLSAFCSEHLARTPEPCEVEFEFTNMQGREIKKARMTIAFGTGSFLDLRASEAGSRGSAVEVIPCVKVLRGAAVASFQTFDNIFFRTNLLVNWSDRSIPRTADVDFALVGITAFDTARLSVFCEGEGTSPSPCDVTLIFHDLRGRVVKQSQLTLQPGTGGSLDLRAAEAGPTGGHVMVEPCVRTGRGLVVSTLRVLDTLTGHTNALVYPGAGLSPGQ